MIDDLSAPPGLTARNGITAAEALAMMRAVGITADLGEEFPCLLADDPEKLVVIDRHALRYQLLYPTEREWFSLAEVLASRINGRYVDLTGRGEGANVLHARWWDRLRYQAGLLDLDVPALAIPDHASIAARRVAAGFALAFVLNEHRHPGEPLAFSRRFAVVWTGLSDRHVTAGMHELLDLGVLVKVRHVVLTGLRPTPLYMPVQRLISTPTTTQEAAAT
jgi:hypothetical protein